MIKYLLIAAVVHLSFSLIIFFKENNKMKKAPFLFFILLLLPVIGFLFYLFCFDNSLMYKKDKRSRLDPVINIKQVDSSLINKTIKLLDSQGFYVSDFASSAILDVPNYYQQLLQDIANAKEVIIIAVSAFKNDSCGKQIISALLSKPQNIKIFIIYERYVSLSRKIFKKLNKRYNVFITPFYSSVKRCQLYLNHFYHNKMVVVDDVCYIGSTNIDKRELGKKKIKDWSDLMMRFKGNIVDQVYDKLVDDLIDCGYYQLEKKEQNKRGQDIALIYSDPARNRLKTLDLFFHFITNCKKQINILTPFLSLNEVIISALRNAVLTGVEVNFIIPLKKDNRLLHVTTFANVKKLFDLGANIYISPTFYHTKMIIADRQVGYFGSCNFQIKSLVNNYEAGITIFNEKLIEECNNYIDKIIIKSIKLNNKNIKKYIKPKRLLYKIIRLFSV